MTGAGTSDQPWPDDCQWTLLVATVAGAPHKLTFAGAAVRLPPGHPHRAGAHWDTAWLRALAEAVARQIEDIESGEVTPPVPGTGALG